MGNTEDLVGATFDNTTSQSCGHAGCLIAMDRSTEYQQLPAHTGFKKILWGRKEQGLKVKLASKNEEFFLW